MKKIIFLSFFTVFFFFFAGKNDLIAQMSGTYSIGGGAGDDYQTLYSALQYLQTNGADGAVVFELSANYNPISEAYPINISSFSGSSEINTLTIKLTDGISDTIERNNDSAVFYIHDVNNVIIDGSNNGSNSRDLVISNTSLTDGHAAIFVKNSNNIVIKNCILKANGNQITSSGLAAQNTNNLLIENNEIKKAQIGAIVFGDSTFIIGNTIGSTIPNEYLDFGVSCQFGADVFIRNNTFFNYIDDDCYSNDNAIHAVAVNDLTGNVEITGNYIDSLIHTGTNNVVQAIAVSDCNTDSFLIANNRISNIASNSYSDNVLGAIAISSPDLTSMTIAHNSINLPSNDDYGLGGNDYIIAAGFIMDAGTGITFKNNIISNTLGAREGNTNTVIGVAFALNFTYNPFAEIDNNVYFVGGDYSMTAIAINSTPALMNLEQWQNFTGGEQNSISQDSICFKSDDSLQLKPCSPAIARAEYLPNITTDINGIDRSETYPSIGAYEYEIVQANHLEQLIPLKEAGWVTLDWHSGNGYRTAMFMKKGNFLDSTPVPVDGETYVANATYGDGSQIGTSGWYCVYNDFTTEDYNEINITGENGVEYTIMACEYYGSDSNEIYNIDTAVDNPILVLAGNSGKVNEISNNLKIFPNPSSGIVYIDLDTQIEEVSVFDFSGKEVYKQNNMTDNQIDISSLNDGMYLFKIQTNSQIFVQKVVLKK